MLIFFMTPTICSNCKRHYKIIADVVVGSRYVRGIQVVNWPLSRILLSYFASLYVRLITRMPIKDTTAGFVVIKKVIQAIKEENIRFTGYAFQIEMKFKAWFKGFRLTNPHCVQ